MQSFRAIVNRDRSLSAVPLSVYLLMVVALAGQLLFHAAQPRPVALADALPHAPKLEALRIISMGEPVALSKLLMLWLQAFDYQSGVSLSFMDLDPNRLVGWLERISDLDPKGRYPLLAASQMYADIPREDTQRIMSEFVLAQFLKDPNQRWQWLGHITIIAKHRLEDLPLALKYANALADNATGPDVPTWVGQMPIAILEDMGELEAARIFIGGLLVSGEVKKEAEINLLKERLEALEKLLSK
jgi:hypothetical protein